MAKRSHTETFILMRNNASKHRNFYKDFNYEDERVTLVNGKDHDDDDEINVIVDGNEMGQGNGTPKWIKDTIVNIEEFKYECNKINTKIDQLRTIQDEHLKRKATSIFADDSESASNQTYEVEIEFKCQEINKIFNRLHTLLTRTKRWADENHNSRLIRNIFQWEVKEVSDLSQKFRLTQRTYLNKRNENEKIDKEFVITFDDNNFTDLLTANKSNWSQQMFDTETIIHDDGDVRFFQDLHHQKQQQKQSGYLDTETIRQRDQEMTSIVKSIQELNQIFHDINTFVINQGTLLDRIDYNLETVQCSVEAGVDYLRKAEKSMRSARKMKLILILSGFIVLMLLYLVVFR